MTYHEKSCWIALVANVAAWSWYFTVVGKAVAAGYPDHPGLMGMMIPVVILLVIIHIVGHAVTAALDPAEAGAPADERERAAGQRAAAWAYSTLCTGISAVFVASFFWWNTFIVVNSMLAAFLLAETVRFSIALAGLRLRAA